MLSPTRALENTGSEDKPAIRERRNEIGHVIYKSNLSAELATLADWGGNGLNLNTPKKGSMNNTMQ